MPGEGGTQSQACQCYRSRTFLHPTALLAKGMNSNCGSFISAGHLLSPMSCMESLTYAVNSRSCVPLLLRCPQLWSQFEGMRDLLLDRLGICRIAESHSSPLADQLGLTLLPLSVISSCSIPWDLCVPDLKTLVGQVSHRYLPQCGQDRKLLPWQCCYWVQTLNWVWVQHAIQPPALHDHRPELCREGELMLDDRTFIMFPRRWMDNYAQRLGGMC